MESFLLQFVLGYFVFLLAYEASQVVKKVISPNPENHITVDMDFRSSFLEFLASDHWTGNTCCTMHVW